MPDKQRHRGAHPADGKLFDRSCLDDLRSAVAHLSWLLSRGYALDSSLKLVGDRFNLTQRQRMAVRRSACTDELSGAARARMISWRGGRHHGFRCRQVAAIDWRSMGTTC